MARYLLVAPSLALLLALVAGEIPPYIHTCSRNHPNLDKCVEESVRSLTPRLEKGIPELNVPSLEALSVEEVALANLADFRAVATNVKIGGLSKFIIKQLHVDLKNQKIDIELVFPKVYMDADYDVKARILVPINEKGPINTVTDNVGAKATLKFQIVERRGRQLLYFSTMTAKLTITDYQATFKPGENNKNPIVQAINSVLVNSRHEIIESMTPNLEKAISTKVLEISNQVCKHFTYDELFPKDYVP